MGSWSGSRRALSEPVGGWVTSDGGVSQPEDTELIVMNQESGTDVVRKGEEDNGTLQPLCLQRTQQLDAVEACRAHIDDTLKSLDRN